MLEEFLSFDRRGIIPLDSECEPEFFFRARALEYAASEYSDSRIAENVKQEFGYNIISGIEQHRMEDAVSDVKKAYGFDLGWIRGYYAELPVGDLKQSPEGLPFYDNLVFGQMLACNSEREYLVPNVLLVNAIFTESEFYQPVLDKTIRHELIHSARNTLPILSRSAELFEEDIANSLGENPAEIILSAREKLEKRFGNNAGYVLGRLSFSEIQKLRNPLQMLKKGKNLRHRIMAEKLRL